MIAQVEFYTANNKYPKVTTGCGYVRLAATIEYSW